MASVARNAGEQPALEIRLLARISHHLATEAHDRPSITSLRLLAVLNVQSSTPALVKRRAPRTDAPLTHFAASRGEKGGLGSVCRHGSGRRRNFDIEHDQQENLEPRAFPRLTVEMNAALQLMNDSVNG